MSITPLSAARIAGEVGLAGGTITGSAYAVKYGGQVNTIAETKDRQIESERKIKQSYFDTRGELRTKAQDMVNKIQNVTTYGDAYSNSLPNAAFKSDVANAITAARQSSQDFIDSSSKYTS